jgi:PhzF family phenazine biosynthesis protein
MTATVPSSGLSCPAVLVEAFTAKPCSGNGAAVVLLGRPASDAWMQGLARSLNQSETAFLLRHQDHWMLRWFTPSCEVPLCGHATLAALLALRHWSLLPDADGTVFATRSGPLPVRMNQAGLGLINLPTATLEPAVVPAYLETLLQEHLQSGCQGFWRSALRYSVALLDPAAPLQQLPSLAPWLQPEEATGLVLMQPLSGPQPDVAVGDHPGDYQLRFFAPGLGIGEDPVTGSAHALVAPYWLEHLGRSTIAGWQCSPRPGGMLCEWSSSGMIRLAGEGVILWNGWVQRQPDACETSAARWADCCARG